VITVLSFLNSKPIVIDREHTNLDHMPVRIIRIDWRYESMLKMFEKLRWKTICTRPGSSNEIIASTIWRQPYWCGVVCYRSWDDELELIVQKAESIYKRNFVSFNFSNIQSIYYNILNIKLKVCSDIYYVNIFTFF